MMRWLLLLLPVNCWAASIVSDAIDPRCTHCGWWYDSNAKIELPVALDAAGNKICKYDLKGATGSHQARATAIIASDPITGLRLESASSPVFSFTIAPPAIPADLHVVP